MKKSRILAIIAFVMVLALCFTACGKKHECESICDTCGKCTDAACTEDVCADKCAGHKTTGDNTGDNGNEGGNTGDNGNEGGNTGDNGNEGGNTGDDDVVKTTPVITVEADTITINAGMEIELKELASVTDEGDSEVKLIIEDDNDFDNTVEGTYVITYKAINKFGNTATATITIIVEKALPIYSLEVQKNILGESKWQGTKLNFNNHEYFEVTANGDYTSSGIYHNATNSEVTINVSSKGYDAVAIIDANGVVLEGRDGPNGKVVNAANPIRVNSTATIKADDTGKDIKIPAGGYAIVVKIGFAGEGPDFDGRNFIGWNVINYVGNVVRITLEGQEEPVTPYVDQAPVINGNGNTVFAANSEFVLNDSVLAGVTATDDNGTFDPSDDVTVEVIVVDDGGFDINVQKTYAVTLKAVDANGNEAIATRDVQVTTAVISVTIGDKSYDSLDDLVAIDKELDKVGKYLFIIYTPNFNGTYPTDGLNTYGVAVVLNKAGEITRVYDGANGRYLDADNRGTTGYGVDGGVDPKAYISVAVNSLKDGEYLLIAPHANGDVTRKFVLDNGRKPGIKVAITGFEFAPHECVKVCPNPDCGKCLDAACNEAVCVTKCECHKCESICAVCGLCTDATCGEYYCSGKCEGHQHFCESVCQQCSKCTNSACEEDACVAKCEGHTGHLYITIGTSKKIELAENEWAKNEAVTTGTATNKSVWIFDKNYTGTVATNGFGVAVVLDAEGKIARVYDGANGGYWLPSGKQASAHFTTSTFASVAWSELQDGETLVIFINGPKTTNARQLGLDSRYLFNQKMNLDVLA